jgi:hypothetical protein
LNAAAGIAARPASAGRSALAYSTCAAAPAATPGPPAGRAHELVTFIRLERARSAPEVDDAAHDGGLTTLHIEHPITSYEQSRAAFDRAAGLRTDGGVVAQRVCQPIDDDRYVVVQLDFDDAQRAASFLDVLRNRIWADPARSPALHNTPRAVIQPAAEAAIEGATATSA